MNVLRGLNGTAFKIGYDIAAQKGVAVVGMSPGNGYFKRDKIDELLKYCASVFREVKIMIADRPSVHTYLAEGYPPEQAERKARLNGNTLQNHSRDSIGAISTGNVELIEWQSLIDVNPAYRQELRSIEDMYAKNDAFRREARETTRSVLEGKLKHGTPIEDAVDEGIIYLLDELAFLSASPKIFGADRIAYVYHHRWKIYEDLIGGNFGGRRRNDLGFVIVE